MFMHLMLVIRSVYVENAGRHGTNIRPLSMKHLLHFSAVLFFAGLHVVTAEQRVVRNALPPVTAGAGIWVDRGPQVERFQLEKRLEQMDSELRKSRAAQTALIAELERTQAHLLKTRASDKEQVAVQRKLQATQSQLQDLRLELEKLEQAAIVKERSFQVQLDRANQVHRELKAEFTRASNLLDARKETPSASDDGLASLRQKIGKTQAERDEQQEELIQLKKKLANQSRNEQALKELRALHKQELTNYEKELAALRQIQTDKALPQSQIQQLIEQNERLTDENRRLTLSLETANQQATEGQVQEMQQALAEAKAEDTATRKGLETQLNKEGLAPRRVQVLIDNNIRLTEENRRLLRAAQQAADVEAAHKTELGRLQKLLAERTSKTTLTKLSGEKSSILRTGNDRSLAGQNGNIQRLNTHLQERKKYVQTRTESAAVLQKHLTQTHKEVERLEKIVQVDAVAGENRAKSLAEVERRIRDLQDRTITLQQDREDTNVQLTKLLELQTALRSAEGNRDRMKEEIERANSTMDANKTLLETRRKEFNALQEKQRTLKHEIEEEVEMVAQLEAELEAAIKTKQKPDSHSQAGTEQPLPERAVEVTRLHTRISELETDIARSSRSLSMLREQLKKEQDKIDQASHTGMQSDELINPLADTKTLIREREAALNKEQARTKQITNMKSDVDPELARLKKELEAEKKRSAELAALADRHQRLKNEIEDLNNFLSTTQEASQIQLEDMTAVSIERDSLKKLIADYETTINQQKKEISAKDSLVKKIEATRNDNGEKVGTIKNLNEELYKREDTIEKMKSERAELEQKLLEQEAALVRKQKNLNTLQAKFIETRDSNSAPKPSDSEASTTQLKKLIDKEAALPALKGRMTGNENPQAGSLPSADLNREGDGLKPSINERNKTIQRLRAELESEKRKENKLETGKPASPTETKGTRNPSTTIKINPPPSAPAAKATSAELTPAKSGGSSRNNALVAEEIAHQAGRKLQDGKVEEAILEFRRSLKYHPEHEPAKLGLATALYTHGNISESSLLIEEALQQNPLNAKALGLKSIIVRHQGDHARARKIIDTATELQPDDPLLLNYRGIIYSKSDRAEAVNAFRNAVKADPLHAEARFNLAVLLATGNNNEVEEAIEHYETAQKLGSERDERLEKILYR